jgi:hypothetical protein
VLIVPISIKCRLGAGKTTPSLHGASPVSPSDGAQQADGPVSARNGVAEIRRPPRPYGADAPPKERSDLHRWVRSIEAGASQMVGLDETLKTTEKNGFTVIDVMRDKLTFTHFMWRPPQPVADIDTMKPALVYEVPRKA